MKSNIEYLKEDIEKALFLPVSFKDQLMEWINAIESELNGKLSVVDDGKDKLIEELKEEILYLEKNWIDPNADGLVTIDFGYGKVQYYEPDNVKLQCIMEDFAERHSVTIA